jgi:hypothetical protein
LGLWAYIIKKYRRINLGLCHKKIQEDQLGLMSFAHNYYRGCSRDSWIHCFPSTAENSHRPLEPINLGLSHLLIMVIVSSGLIPAHVPLDSSQFETLTNTPETPTKASHNDEVNVTINHHDKRNHSFHTSRGSSTSMPRH